MKKYYYIAKKKLFPLCRSITGKGIIETLKVIRKEFTNFKIKKIKSGSKVYDWKIPSEWNIKDAYVKDHTGKKIIDFKKNNLHILGYSGPVNKLISKNDLIKKLYYLKKQPDAIPYVTSYYQKRWGFCITHNNFKKIQTNYKTKDKFKVFIDSNFNKKGNLNYGEIILRGSSKQEILVSTYVCHPSMANNELSGPIVSMSLINYYKKFNKLKKTIRFIFIPETIGSISYLNKNLSYLKNTIGGFNLTCIGDERNHSCMFSKYGNKPSDFAIIQAYKKIKIKKFKIYPFLSRGSDERQFNSPGIDLPISSIFRTKYGEFPEYHTSLDNFNLVTIKGLKGGYNVAKESINILLKNIYPKSKILCEPQMSKRGLYPTISSKNNVILSQKYLDFLQYSDGTNSLLQISKRIKLKIRDVKKINRILLYKNLVIN